MPRMNVRNYFSVCCLALLAGALPALGSAIPSEVLDPKIQSAVAAVSRVSLRASDLALVNFGSRHTLGTSLPPEKKAGVVAARQWITSQLQQFAQECKGCLEVKSYSFTDGPAP